MAFICPVCGYPSLEEEPWNDERGGSDDNCYSCGIEFGYHDEPLASGAEGTREEIHERWRDEWIKNGMKWKSLSLKPPKDWDPVKQLENIGIYLDRD